MATSETETQYIFSTSNGSAVVRSTKEADAPPFTGTNGHTVYKRIDIKHECYCVIQDDTEKTEIASGVYTVPAHGILIQAEVI